ncbi:hypothetical protein [Kitasatospora fiedleri]|uniref:hypothetical protein n=1 Tax=Kitasatospora fiedleri TaxID=2991545 RepID=UPI00249CA8B2|nr:hypothetical protein [Kitasatospora fiedleri]
MELVERAWHDAYHEIAPTEEVIDDILTCSQGDLGRLIHFGLLAVVDARDLWVAVEKIRAAETAAPAVPPAEVP